MVLRGTATDADLYHRSINTSETLSGRTAVNDAGTDLEGNQDTHAVPHAPPRIYVDGATEKIGVTFIDTIEDQHFSDSDVGTISFAADQTVTTTNVASSAGGSAAAQMALMWDDVDDEPISLFVTEADESIVKIVTRISGSWTGEVTELDVTNSVGWIRGRVFTHSSGNGGDRVVGYIYDEHLNPGGTGGVAYREIVRAVGGNATANLTTIQATVTITTVATTTSASITLTAVAAVVSLTATTQTTSATVNATAVNVVVTITAPATTASAEPALTAITALVTLNQPAASSAHTVGLLAHFSSMIG